MSSSEGVFSNLESLVLRRVRPNHPILQTLNRTTTTRLRKLNLSHSDTRDEDINSQYGPMLERITSLILSNTAGCFPYIKVPPIPTNITYLEDDLRHAHPFPYVRTYKLDVGVFRAGCIIDLQRLTTLITNIAFLQDGCQLVLPSLRHLACGSIIFDNCAALDAPRLELLEYFDGPRVDKRRQPHHIVEALEHPAFLLSHLKSLSLRQSASNNITQMILIRYKRLERLEITLARDLVFSTLTTALTGRVREEGFACPELTELRLVLAEECQDLHPLEWWRDQAAQIGGERRGFATIPRVYGSWDEGKTFTLLA
jgi:hypothetical protein